MGFTDAPIRAGLIYQRKEQAERLKQTLREAGIDLTVELDVAGLRAGGLDDEHVEVYIVNLEAEIEDLLDEVTELLDATTKPVVYNDADVSSDLSGWDQARWARHLAAKIHKERGLLPPTPVGAQAIPVPRKQEPAVPVAVEESAPVETAEAAIDFDSLEVTDTADEALETVVVEEAEAPPAEATEELPESPLLDLSLELLDEPAASFDQALNEGIESDTWAVSPESPDDEAVQADAPLTEPAEPSSQHGDTAASLLMGEDLGLALDVDDLATGGVGGDQVEGASTSDWGLDLPAEEMSGLAEQLDTLPEASGDAPLDPEPAPAEPEKEALELDLDLGLELGSETTLSAATDDAGLDAVDELDDLSLFAAADAPAVDDLEVLDAPAEDGLGLDDLDSLFDDSAPLQTEAVDEDQGLDLGEVGIELQEELVELELDGTLPVGEDDSLPAADDLASSTVPDLDELFEGAPEESAVSGEGGGEAPRSPGLSLPDISEWVLEPLDDEAEDTATAEKQAALAAHGLDLRDLASGKPSTTPTQPASSKPTPAPASASQSPTESSGNLDSDSLDLDLGIDFGELDLIAEPEAPPPPAPAPASAAVAATAAAGPASDGPQRVVILGASIGGPDSIRSYLKAIDADLKAAFVLVQHMGAEFLELMAQQLDRVTPLQVQLATQGSRLKEGEVLVAPVGKRLMFDDQAVADLSQDAGNTAYSPSIDQVLTDSLERWGAKRLLVIIFSGMANDAVSGARQLAEAGVPIWAQDPASCVISSMVDGVVAAKVVSFIGTPEQLAEQTNRLLA